VDRAPVTSSAVVSVGYDTVRQILELEFVDGDVYQYYDVPQTTHKALLNAPSIGPFVNTDVKGRFRYTKL
jgi:glutamine cyclotransferase